MATKRCKMNDDFLDSLKSFFIETMRNEAMDISPNDKEVEEDAIEDEKYVHLQNPSNSSYRVYNQDELFKIHHSCLVLIQNATDEGLISPDERESLINEILDFDSAFITTEELRYALYSHFSDEFDDNRLLFLDFYLDEGEHTAH